MIRPGMCSLLVLSAAACVYADTAVQTDWSGGPGVPGPVTDWSNTFDWSENLDYAGIPGEVSLTWGKLTDVSESLPGSAQYGIHVSTGDVDSDGDLDILSAASIDNIVVWWENLDGEATSWASHVIVSDFAGAWGAECADIDKDGDQDIFGSAMSADDVLWWENDGSGGTWTEHMIDDSLDGAKAILAVDMNDDGEVDVLVAAKGADEVAWYSNGGSGSSWVKHIVVSGYDEALSVYACDMDLDDDLDVLSVAKSDDAIRWYENANGAGTSWIEHSIEENLDVARTAEAADIDGDGDIDVVGTGGKSKEPFGEVSWWENTDGSGTVWTKHVIDPDHCGPYTVLAHDIDDDGDPDVFSSSLTTNDISWWENTGAGSTWEKHVIGDYFAPLTIHLADIDGDGREEALAGSLYAFDIQWWRILGYHPAGELVSSVLDTGGDCDWGEVSWTENCPTGTSVGLMVRSSWDSGDLGDWSDTVFTSPADLSLLLDDGDRFAQYSICLLSPICDETPDLQELAITWNSLSVESGEERQVGLRILGGNPGTGVATLSCWLDEPAIARLSIFDLSGRLVWTTGELQLQAGENTTHVGELHNGIYIARLSLGENQHVAKFTVVQ